jgi:hypothetical protein
VTECKVQSEDLPLCLPKVGNSNNWPTPLEDDASNVNPSDKRMKTLVSSTKGSGMKLNGAMIVTNTGSIYEAQNQLRHKTYRTTEKSYADLITISDYTVEIPKVS